MNETINANYGLVPFRLVIYSVSCTLEHFYRANFHPTLHGTFSGVINQQRVLLLGLKRMSHLGVIYSQKKCVTCRTVSIFFMLQTSTNSRTWKKNLESMNKQKVCSGTLWRAKKRKNMNAMKDEKKRLCKQAPKHSLFWDAVYLKSCVRDRLSGIIALSSELFLV